MDLSDMRRLSDPVELTATWRAAETHELYLDELCLLRWYASCYVSMTLFLWLLGQ